MKIRNAILLFFVATFVSYWFVDAGSRGRYANSNDGNYIADYYMPLVRAMDTMDDVIGTEDNQKKRYELVVLYVYNLNESEEQPTGSVDGQPVYSTAYKAVHNTYDAIQSYVERENERFEDAGPRGVKFIAVNLFHGNMNTLPEKYNLGREPLLAFFRNSELVAQQPLGMSVTSAEEVKRFLTKAKFYDFLDDATQRYQSKEASERKRDRRARRYYYGSGGPYLGYGYGFGYRPYYYPGPGSYWGPGYYGYYNRPYGGLYIGW
jgi:hypothetical protein